MQSSCSGKRRCGPCVKAITALRPQRYTFSARRTTFSLVFSPFDRGTLFSCRRTDGQKRGYDDFPQKGGKTKRARAAPLTEEHASPTVHLHLACCQRNASHRADLHPRCQTYSSPCSAVRHRGYSAACPTGLWHQHDFCYIIYIFLYIELSHQIS